MIRSAFSFAPEYEPDTSQERFAVFYADYHPRVRRYAIRCFGYGHADEVAQEAMAKAFACFDRLDLSRDPWPWLAVVTRNVGLNLVRQLGRCDLVKEDAFSGLDSGEWCDPVWNAESQERRAMIAKALEALPAGQRRVVLLRLVEGLGFDAIAELLGSTENAVRQQLFKGRKSFATHFEALGGRIGTVLPIFGLGRSLARRLGGSGRELGPVVAAGLTAAASALVLGAALSVPTATSPDFIAPTNGAGSVASVPVGRSAATTRPAALSVRDPTPSVRKGSESTARHGVSLQQGPAAARARLGRSFFAQGEYVSVGVTVETPVGKAHYELKTERRPGMSPACQTGLVTCS